MSPVATSALKVTTRIIIGAVLFTMASAAYAGPREQAAKMFNRLNGVPPSPDTLDQMEQLVTEGKLGAAALMAIEDERGNFYNITLKDMITPWTNEDLNARRPLDDYTATVIGFVRDEIPFNKILSEDAVYIASPDPAVFVDEGGNPINLPTYSTVNNDHFTAVEENDLPLHQVLVKRKQSEVGSLPTDATAGILTTWGFSKDYYNAGTNRAAVRFTFMTYLCHDMEELNDTTRPTFRVRQDVTRAPGGDSTLFKNKCQGCHAGMDGHGGAFAYMDHTAEEGLIYDPLAVREKMIRNDHEFPDGYRTFDDSWVNLWTEGPNKKLGWSGRTKGKGLKSWGIMMTQTEAFARCMAKRSLETICLTDDSTPEGKKAIDQLTFAFKANGRYNMKHLFAKTAIMCRGE